jgi:solute carrier family 25 folate transporter 32
MATQTTNSPPAFNPIIRDHLIAGTTAGCVSTILLYPLDIIKVRYAVHTHRNPSILSGLAHMWRVEGTRSLYQGMLPACVGSSVAWGGYFFFYERAKIRMIAAEEDGSGRGLHSGHHIRAGFEAGTVMVLFTNPIWLIKTRMQLQRTQAAHAVTTATSPNFPNAGVDKRYTGMLNAFTTILREEGVLGLYKGVLPAMVGTTHGVVQFTVYEQLKKIDDKYIPRSIFTLAIGGLSKIIAATITFPYQVRESVYSSFLL